MLNQKSKKRHENEETHPPPCQAALLALAACTQDETAIPTGETHATLPYGEYPLQIGGVTLDAESSAEPWSAEGPQTRVAENDNGTGSVWQWNGSEMIGVRLGDETADYTLNAGKTLTSDNQLYRTSTAPATVAAWYPTDETVDLSDQSERLAYVLKAEVPNATYDNEITLGFKHQLAKVRVVLNGTQASLAQSVEVYGYTTCTNDEGAPVIDNAQQGWLKMKKQTYGNTECWEANVVPGDITITDFIRINGQTATVNDGFPTTLDAARMYTIDLTVGENQIFGGETITKPGEYIVKGTVTESITLDSEGVTLTLEEADINTNGIAINIVSGNPTLKIQGTENAVKSTTSTAIHVGSGCTLTIEGVNGTADKLKAEGGKNDGTATTGAGNAGAGIGSSNGGNIIIRNITIEAQGNSWYHYLGQVQGGGAAIGSSGPGYCGDITITDATITAIGGHYAAAIGMGYSLEGSEDSNLKMGTIRISNSIITAQGGEGASAVGFPYLNLQQSPTAGEIYIETKESSNTFLNRLTITSGKFKIGKGSFNDYNSFYGTSRQICPPPVLRILFFRPLNPPLRPSQAKHPPPS